MKANDSQIVDTPFVEFPDELASLALALGARDIPDLSASEARLEQIESLPSDLVSRTQEAIRRGEDPLGDAFCKLFSPEARRPKGATYTPHTIVQAMLAWARTRIDPVRVIDPGAGSGRFLVAAGRTFPKAELIAIELDPLAALLTRGHLAAAGLGDRATVLVGDYRDLAIKPIGGRTLFLGNPPYVRHHLLGQKWKNWLVQTARRHGHDASQLAGLHVHFFLATAEHAKAGDVGVLITAAEWLDVNYGRLVREMLLGILGAKNIQVIEPSAEPFPGTATTAVITGFEVGAQPESIGLRRVATLKDLGELQVDRKVRRERLQNANRWTPLTRTTADKREGLVELGELCRVHRGQVTGANRIWIADPDGHGLPDSVLFPSVTRARELFDAKGLLRDASVLRRVIDLPVDLSVLDLDKGARRQIDQFLKLAKAQGADSGFVARNRKAWWSVGLRDPAPILATYMARRPPAFVRNVVGARHINIAHGLYPREPLDESQLRALANWLSRCTNVADGRTYSGGLTKFEPREMERLLVPQPELLTDQAFLETMA